MPGAPRTLLLSVALSAGAAGWLLGRATAPEGRGPADPGETRPAPSARVPPALTGSRAPEAPARPPPAAPLPAPMPGAAGPAPAPSATGEPAPTLDLASLADFRALRHPPLTAFTGGSKEGREPDLPPPAAAEAQRLLASAPEEARERLERLLDSGDPVERRWAYRLLSQARHPSQRDLVERAVREAREGEDVRSLLRTLASLKDRPWSAKQLTGAPDTPIAGDLETAWAAKSPQMGEVWIDLSYAEAVVPEGVRIHETFNPGAVARVLARRADGSWAQLWSGEDPTRSAPAWFEPPLERLGFPTRHLRLIVDTDRVEGWNELDAVELLGDGRRQWAVDALAGSSYAD